VKLLQQQEDAAKKAEKAKKAEEAAQAATRENTDIVMDETAKQTLSDSLAAAMQNDPALAAKVQQATDSGKKRL